MNGSTPETDPGRDSRHRVIAWALVGLQALILVALVLLPSGTSWKVGGAVSTLAAVLFWSGGALAVGAGLQLGLGLTALPLPSPRGRLVTGGLFALARHPIYTGVILLSAGIALRSANPVKVLLVVALTVFFAFKARWEERRLVEAYGGYAEYAARTGRFVPGLGRLRPGGHT